MNSTSIEPSDIYNHIHSIAAQERVKAYEANWLAIESQIEVIEKSSMLPCKKKKLLTLLNAELQRGLPDLHDPLWQVSFELEGLKLELENALPESFADFYD